MTEAGSSSSSSSSSSHGRGGQAQAGPMSAMAAQSQSQSQSKRLQDPRLRAGAGGVAASAPRSDKGKGRSATDCDGDCDSQEQELQLHTCGHEQQQQQQPADLRVTMMQSQITPKSGLPLFDALDVETLRLENDMLRRQAAVLASRNGSLRTASPGDAASLMMRGSLAGTDRLDDPDLRHLVEQVRQSQIPSQRDSARYPNATDISSETSLRTPEPTALLHCPAEGQRAPEDTPARVERPARPPRAGAALSALLPPRKRPASLCRGGAQARAAKRFRRRHGQVRPTRQQQHGSSRST